MPRTVCLFSELDNYTGSYSQNMKSFHELIRNLKIACLLYDEVIVHSNALLDHPLTLPAFENLSHFTKAGVLWTTAPRSQGSPDEYALLRAQRYYGENLNIGISRVRREELCKILERWQLISPSEWRLTRDSSNQQGSATQNIIKNLKSIGTISKAADKVRSIMIEIVLHMQEKGIFVRDELLSRLGSMREYLTLDEFSKMGLIILKEYTSQGESNKDDIKIVLYPGKYIRYLHKYDFLFRASTLPSDFNTLEKTEYRLSQSGFPIKDLDLLPSLDIFELSQSLEWKMWRNYFLSDNFSPESLKEMNSLRRRHEKLLPILSVIIKNINSPNESSAIEVPHFLLPSPWLTLGMSLTGVVQKKDHSARRQTVVLDLNTRVLQYLSKKVLIDKSFVSLISLFSAVDNHGVPVEMIKQLDLEVDLVKRNYLYTWRFQAEDKEEAAIARLNRLNVYKTRLNAILKNLDLEIIVKKGDGIWKMVALSSCSVVNVILKNSPWELEKNISYNTHPPPENLTVKQLAIWKFLTNKYGQFVSSNALSIELSMPQLTNQQVSRFMYKLQKKIDKTHYKIITSHQGEYCIIHLTTEQ